MNYVLVTHENKAEVYHRLLKADVIALDTETTGLKFKDRMFSLILCDGESVYYFNFHKYCEDTNGVVPSFEVEYMMIFLGDIFRLNITWIMANAPFDLHRLWLEGVTLNGKIWDVLSAAVIENNQHFQYNLASCLERIGLEKDTTVEKWISKNKAYTWESIEGKGKRDKLKHYEQVPFDIMFKYGCMDGEGTYKLYEHQYIECRDFMGVENHVARICHRIYARGIEVDKEYTKACWDNEVILKGNAINEIERMSSTTFSNSPKYFAGILEAAGEKIEYSEKGNPIVDKHALEKMSSPIAEQIKEFRRSGKYIETYYTNFLHKSKDDGLYHPSLKSMGAAATGRFSSASQQFPKKAMNGFETRKCFVPRKGYTFIAIDYSAQEFRLMLDYANEKRLIKDIMAGVDPHQATADDIGISRSHAKTVNFGLLYGVGVTELSKMLSLSIPETRKLKSKYFGRLPRVKRFLDSVVRVVKKRGYVKTFTGRKLYLPDVYIKGKKIDFSYKMPNAIIQGGSADMVKIAMVACQKYIDKNNLDIHILLTVHDELIFECNSELVEEHADKLRQIMVEAYDPMNECYQDCSVDISDVSMGKSDLEGKEDE